MNRVDRKTNIDWDLVPNDAYGPVAALVTIADQAVEDAGPWPGWRDDLWEASEEIGRLRKRVAELERALGDLLEALTHHENRLTDEALQQERRARRALDRERTGEEEGSGVERRSVWPGVELPGYGGCLGDSDVVKHGKVYQLGSAPGELDAHVRPGCCQLRSEIDWVSGEDRNEPLTISFNDDDAILLRAVADITAGKMEQVDHLRYRADPAPSSGEREPEPEGEATDE